MKIKKLNEAFNVDTVQKRIARHNEFDNGHVLHNYEKMTSAEAEEKARLASIENPNDIYYVSYDDIMNPSSDIKWKNGKQVTEQLEAEGEDGWGDEIEETLEDVFDKMNAIQYEVNSCVRGSYSVDGDKVENLVSELEEVQDMLNDKIEFLKHQSDELNETFNDNLGEKLNEASYGGAFDIADDQYFTREDLNDFAEEVLNRINEAFVTQFDVSACYIDDGVLELEVTNSEYGDYDWSEKIDMRKIKKPEDLNKNYASWFASQLINEITQSNNGLIESKGKLKKGLTEDATDIETETLEGPKQGPEFGLAALLNDAIKDEWDAIDTYNSLAVSARDEGFENIAEVIDEINTEENKHVGQLQEILKTISPNTDAIKVGEQEGKEQMSEASDNDTDFELSSEFGISDDDDISEAEMQEALNQIKKLKECVNNSTNIPNNKNDVNINDIEEEVVDMREAWEDIYDSFKKIETDLKGDGEAITATIDRLYNDNKSNPDFKKAYDKWASGN